MKYEDLIRDIEKDYKINTAKITGAHADEVYIDLNKEDFNSMCLALHKKLKSPVMMLFAVDERSEKGAFAVICAFLGSEYKKWFFARTYVDGAAPCFNSLSKEIYSASLFEREMKEMFGIEPAGNPDVRRLHLHDEVWRENSFPLRKDFKAPSELKENKNKYIFKKIEGEGVFEVPVGPVHAGIIGPGHFRFSAAGEPIINLEIRLGFTHRGVEKLFENKKAVEAVRIAECVSGDSSFGHSLAFCRAIEKISGITPSEEDSYLRAIFLELERMYNHVADIGGIALDVGFSFPSAYAAVIKESLLTLNHKLTANRYLRGINIVGGTSKHLGGEHKTLLGGALKNILKDFKELKNMLTASVSFMDRVDNTGILKKKTAEDLGVVGLAGRASGLHMDLRKDFPDVYENVKFNTAQGGRGDVLARLNLRMAEFEESVYFIEEFLDRLNAANKSQTNGTNPAGNIALGYAEAWRGPVLYWVKLDKSGLIERCKIVDPSFHNWPALSYAVLGNIIPDFPLCNKSFNLSYSGNDL